MQLKQNKASTCTVLSLIESIKIQISSFLHFLNKNFINTWTQELVFKITIKECLQTFIRIFTFLTLSIQCSILKKSNLLEHSVRPLGKRSNLHSQFFNTWQSIYPSLHNLLHTIHVATATKIKLKSWHNGMF